jgi:hypothetical protein
MWEMIMDLDIRPTYVRTDDREATFHLQVSFWPQQDPLVCADLGGLYVDKFETEVKINPFSSYASFARALADAMGRIADCVQRRYKEAHEAAGAETQAGDGEGVAGDEVRGTDDPEGC